MTFGLGTLFALLAVAGGLIYRQRLNSMDARNRPVTDDMIRRIEEDGRIELEEDEPLDMKRIREEEERFLEETWDEPDE